MGELVSRKYGAAEGVAVSSATGASVGALVGLVTGALEEGLVTGLLVGLLVGLGNLVISWDMGTGTDSASSFTICGFSRSC